MASSAIHAETCVFPQETVQVSAHLAKSLNCHDASSFPLSIRSLQRMVSWKRPDTVNPASRTQMVANVTINHDAPENHKELDIVYIPEAYRAKYPLLFGNEFTSLPVLVEEASFKVSLSKVILTCTDEEKWAIIQRDQAKFKSDLLQQSRDNVIFQGGDIAGLGIITTEPTLQGYLDPDTEVLVAFYDDGRHEDLDPHFEIPDDSALFDEWSQPESSSLSLHALDAPVSDLALVPRPAPDDDDAYRIYVRSTHDLAKIGVFSGDWVSVSGPTGSEKLARIFVAETECDWEKTAADDAQSSIPAFTTPMLLFAVAQTCAPISVSVAAREVSPFPVASAISVSRIASSLTVSRRYQKLFLNALRVHLQSKRRLVAEGDIVSVGLWEDGNRFQAVALDDKEENEDDIDLPSIKDEQKPTTAVHFRIGSIEGDGGPCYIVNPHHTKIVLSGLEQALVPHVAEYMEMPWWTSKAGFLKRDHLTQYLKSTLETANANLDMLQSLLVTGNRGSGKSALVRATSSIAGFHYIDIDCYSLLDESDAKTVGVFKFKVELAQSCAPCVLVLKNIEALAQKSQAQETGHEPQLVYLISDALQPLRDVKLSGNYPVVLVGTSVDKDRVSSGILAFFKEQVHIDAPTEPERLTLLSDLARHDALAPDVSLKSLAIQTAALVSQDLVDLVSRIRLAAVNRLTRSLSPQVDVDTVIRQYGLCLLQRDVDEALDQARRAYSDSIGAPKIPSVTWDDVGGLASVKKDILDTIQLPLEHPELFAGGAKKRSGVLFYGPPGTGKTLLAKAVATSCSLNFMSVKGPELLNMYIGESEANVRRVFQRARDAKPCVIFFDELDSVAPKRGNQGDSGGVMDRIVSQLLAELDGMSSSGGGTPDDPTPSADVFVIGATNRPDLLDPALLRPGRFDKLLYLGVSDTHEAQLNIIQALTRKFRLDPAFDLSDFSRKLPFNLTGADFYALCSDAMLKAMSGAAGAVDAKISALNAAPPYSTGEKAALTPQFYLAELASPEEVQVVVGSEDFDSALAELVPSVSMAEMEHYKLVQARFSQPDEAEPESPPHEITRSAATAGPLKEGDTLDLSSSNGHPKPSNGV